MDLVPVRNVSRSVAASTTIGTGAISFETVEPLVYAKNAQCASGGQMRVSVEQGDALVSFTESGGIEVDYNADGSVEDTFKSCTDAKLKKCG